MRLAPPPLEVGDRDGFDGTDIFGYEEFGRNLAPLVENLEGPAVIALDGGWGSGKTVFAKQWAGLLRQRGSAVIYFDAFAADAGDDPLFDIASQLFAAAPDGEKRNDLAKAAGVFAKQFLPVVAGVGLRVATGGLMGGEAIGAGAAGVTEARKAAMGRGEEVSEAFRQRIEGAQDRAGVLLDLRQKLIALAEAMKANALDDVNEVPEPEKPRPVVMIVDELDRCRPPYALNLLENLKHVLDVQNICFVLITNLRQLTQVVAKQYGVSKADIYLEKFVQATFVLPEKERYAKNRQYIRHLFQENLGFEGNSHLRVPIEMAVSHAGTSLRGIEKVIPNVAWCLASGVFREGIGSARWLARDYEQILIPVVVCVIRALNPEMYAAIRIDRITPDEVMDFLCVKEWEVQATVKRQTRSALSAAFPPAAAVQGDTEKMREWKLGSLPSLVGRVCGLLDVLGDSARFLRQ